MRPAQNGKDVSATSLPSRSARAVPRAGRVAVLAALGGAALAACAVDPKKDYDDFVKDTNDLRGEVVNGTGGGGGSGPKACAETTPRKVDPLDPQPKADGLYIVTCLARLSQCDTVKALRFRVDVAAPDAQGVAMATYHALTTGGRSAKETAADAPTFVVMHHQEASGRFSTVAPINAALPADANPISMRPIDFKGVTFEGFQFPLDGRMFACAELDGVADVYVTSDAPPQAVSLTTPGDTCLITPVASEDQIVDPPLTDYHCP